jgi:hypothetical protein
MKLITNLFRIGFKSSKSLHFNKRDRLGSSFPISLGALVYKNCTRTANTKHIDLCKKAPP